MIKISFPSTVLFISDSKSDLDNFKIKLNRNVYQVKFININECFEFFDSYQKIISPSNFITEKPIFLENNKVFITSNTSWLTSLITNTEKYSQIHSVILLDKNNIINKREFFTHVLSKDKLIKNILISDSKTTSFQEINQLFNENLIFNFLHINQTSSTSLNNILSKSHDSYFRELTYFLDNFLLNNKDYEKLSGKIYNEEDFYEWYTLLTPFFSLITIDKNYNLELSFICDENYLKSMMELSSIENIPTLTDLSSNSLHIKMHELSNILQSTFIAENNFLFNSEKIQLNNKNYYTSNTSISRIKYKN